MLGGLRSILGLRKCFVEKAVKTACRTFFCSLKIKKCIKIPIKIGRSSITRYARVKLLMFCMSKVWCFFFFSTTVWGICDSYAVKLFGFAVHLVVAKFFFLLLFCSIAIPDFQTDSATAASVVAKSFTWTDSVDQEIPIPPSPLPKKVSIAKIQSLYLEKRCQES